MPKLNQILKSMKMDKKYLLSVLFLTLLLSWFNNIRLLPSERLAFIQTETKETVPTIEPSATPSPASQYQLGTAPSSATSASPASKYQLGTAPTPPTPNSSASKYQLGTTPIKANNSTSTSEPQEDSHE